jgi:hypothetical protein
VFNEASHFMFVGRQTTRTNYTNSLEQILPEKLTVAQLVKKFHSFLEKVK